MRRVEAGLSARLFTESGPWSAAVLIAIMLSCAAAFSNAMLFANTNNVESGAVDANVLHVQARRIDAIAEAAPNVVAVFSADGKSGGSGVVISPDGFALTNYHVVQPCGTAMIAGLADGRLYDAVLVGIDPTGDVALIKLLGREDFPCAPLGDSDHVRVGDEVFAMGNPLMLATDLQPSVSWGIVSGTHRYQFPAGTILEYADCLQTDAAINPGNSGGPLFDAQARLIGINGRCSFEKRGRVSVGVGYAISINQIKNFLGHLRGGMIVDHATLGATVAFDAGGRVVVDDILEDSDAYRRGLRYGDVVEQFAGRDVDSPNALKNVLGTLPQGWRVSLVFRRDGNRRDGNRREILVRLAGVHSRSELLETIKKPVQPPMPLRPKGDRNGRGDEHKPAQGESRRPIDTSPNMTRPPMPDIVKRNFLKKHGYANSHFNLTECRRVLDAWAARCGLTWQNEKHEADAGRSSKQEKPWKIEAFTRSGQKAAIELSDEGAVIRCGDNEYQWTLPRKLGGDAAAVSLDPPGSGGLLAALYFWKRLASLGPDAFGDFHYAGIAPRYEHGRAGASQPADVLVGLVAGIECRFYFDRVAHDLIAIEMSAPYATDPCEVYFDDYRRLGEKWLPARIESRHGDELFEIFSLGPPGEIESTHVANVNNGQTHIEYNAGFPPISARSRLIRDAQRKVVKIQGAGGFRGLEGYQSGILISSQGHVITALTSALDTDQLGVTLDDGRRLEATLVGGDPELELAVLKIDAGGGLPCFDLGADQTDSSLETGAWVLALGNLFGVAVGDEPVSVLRGVVAAKTRLSAGLGVFETPYHGPVYVLDAATNNPGAAGGALVDLRGRLVGMLGKELQNKLNNTWLNYALPTGQLKNSVEQILSGRFSTEPLAERKKVAQPFDMASLGIVLVPDVLQRTPPYIDSLHPGSIAQTAGLLPDDLIVLVGNRLVQSCKQVDEELSYLPAGGVLNISIIRGHELLKFTLRSEEFPPTDAAKQ